MKGTSILVLAIVAIGALACSGDKVKYDVTGSQAPKDGAVVYLMDQMSSMPIDSTVVSNGSFKMKGNATKDAFLAVAIDGSGWWFMFFNDGKPVRVNVADSTLTGSALNTRLTECDKRNTAAYGEYTRFLEEFISLPEAEMEARIPDYRTALQKYADFYLGLIDENRDNLIPVAFIKSVPSLAGEEKFNELLASDAPFAKHPYVLDLKRKIDESNAEWQESKVRKQEFVGQKFLDLEEPDLEGIMHKLSEYVGNGKWVLVDFWASWCGPCKAEMPNVVAAYKKYHTKGFDIVGLSFDREKDPWVKAIKDWDMPWIHLSDLQYWKSAPFDVYNVNSIPDNLLIDPEGIIVARGLRGEDLESKLCEIFK